MGFFGNLRDFLGFLALEKNYLVLLGPDGNLIVGNSLYNDHFSESESPPQLPGQFDALAHCDLDKIKAQIFVFSPYTEIQALESIAGDQVFVEWQCFDFQFEGRNHKLKIGTDVTDREYIRQKLDEIGTVAKIGYWRMGARSREIYWSPEVFNIHGMPADSFLPDLRSVSSLYCDESWENIENCMGDCFEKGKPFSCKIKAFDGNDDCKYIEMEGSPDFNQSGRIVAISGTFRDRSQEALTESRYSHVHEELRKAQDLTSHLENTLDEHALVSIADAAGKIIYVNQKFCDVSGYTAEELIGQNHRILKSEEHDAGFYRDLWQTISSGQVWRGEVCNLRKSGDPYWVSSTIVPYLDGKTGKLVHYVSVRTDITELKKFQSYQDEMLNKAQELNQTKSDFLANMSHELRTPLNAILGYSEMLQEQYFGDLGHAKYDEYVKYIHSSGKRLLDLINDVLDISKIEAGRYEVSRDFASMERILDDIFHEFIPMAIAARVKLRIENPDKIERVYVDEKAVKQIMANLVSNAIKYSSPESDVGLTVWSEKAGQLSIEVRDQGIGMSKRDMEIALSPFGQVQDAQIKSFQGTGLGLPLCKHLAQLHGGELQLDSELGLGTSVTVRLPGCEEGESRMFATV